MALTIDQLIYEEVTAINHYEEWLQEHRHLLTAKEIGAIKEIIADEKDHLRIDLNIGKMLR